MAAKVSAALDNYTEGEVAQAVETNKDTAQSWKLGRRAPNSSYIMAMGKAFDEIGMMIAEEIDAGRFYNREAALRKRLNDLAMEENDIGRAARQILRDVGQ